MTFLKNKDKKENPKYYEAVGDLKGTNQIFKHIVILLLIIIVFLIVIIRQLIIKPPTVIRIDSDGIVSYHKNYKAAVQVTTIEIKKFIEIFLQRFLENNVYTLKKELERSFEMIHPDYYGSMNQYLENSEFLKIVENQKGKTKLNITMIEVLKDSPEYIELVVKGTREITLYDDKKYYKEIIFENNIVLKRVKRAEDNKWGLYIVSFKESIFKK